MEQTMSNVFTARNGVSLAGRVLPDLTKPAAPSMEDMLAQIEALKAQLANASKPKALTLKVSEKGALSIYGLGRFPITLYLSQFDKLNAAWPDVQAFVEANRARFTTKE
jgi:hypothetical protein